MFYKFISILMIVLFICGTVAGVLGHFALAYVLLSGPAGWAAGGCVGELIFERR
jgi:hypothetical protein